MPTPSEHYQRAEDLLGLAAALLEAEHVDRDAVDRAVRVAHVHAILSTAQEL